MLPRPLKEEAEGPGSTEAEALPGPGAPPQQLQWRGGSRQPSDFYLYPGFRRVHGLPGDPASSSGKV